MSGLLITGRQPAQRDVFWRSLGNGTILLLRTSRTVKLTTQGSIQSSETVATVETFHTSILIVKKLVSDDNNCLAFCFKLPVVLNVPFHITVIGPD